MSLAKTPRKRKQKGDFYKLKLITSKSKEEFLEEYEKYDEQSAKDFYLRVLFELEKSVKVGNIDNLKCLSCAIDNFSCLENKTSVKNFFGDSRNPFKSTNLIILASKHNQVEVLKYLFQSDKILKNLSVQAGKNVSPKDEDETCHNAFYYAIRSGNLHLLKILRNWTENFFSDHKCELDEILSKSCEELKLKNVPLTDQMEILVEDILIDLRFSSNTFKHNENISDLDNINKRIELVLENINLLKSEKSDTDINETFLYVVKFIAQNIHVLKRLLKSTYDRLPWEELEFCLIAFASSHTKFQEINFFYHAALDKRKLLHYLQVFASRLEEVKRSIKGVNINRLAILPNLDRETVIREIMNRNPEFVELYKNYQQIRDIHSLEKINKCINLAVTVDPREKEGQIVIIRVLQLIGEYLKNTLESPKLSKATSELLLLSLSRSTRKVVTDLRNSLSHASSLFKRTDIQEHSDIKFFTGVQSDIKKIGNAIIDILYDKKIKVIRKLLKKIIDSEDFNEIREVIKLLKHCQTEDINSDYCKTILKIFGANENSNYFKTMEHDKLKTLIKELYDNIADKTPEEEELFIKINQKISSEKCEFNSAQDHYFLGLSALKSLEIALMYNKIDHNIIRGLKFTANEALKNITSPIESVNLKEIAELSQKVFYSVKSRKYLKNFDNIDILFYKIFYIAEFQAGDIKWIEDFRGKLNEETSFISALNQKNNTEVNPQLALKLSELKSVLKKLFSSSEEIEKVCSYKANEKSQAIVEMILLDIMSILSISDYYLVNNLFFLDDNYPLLTGKSLRNHLAHDNTILEILLTNPCIAIVLNAKKVIEEDIVVKKKKIGKLTADDPVRLREKHCQGLKIIALQRKMYVALEDGNLEIVKECLKNGADINARSINSWTVLHFAAKGSNLEMIKFILEQNVQVNIKDQNGQNPLHIAATYGNTSIVEYFIKETSLLVDDVDDLFKTPLHLAAQKGHEDVVELLLKHNADFASKDLCGMLPLHYAIRNNHFGIAKTLLSKDNNVDISESMGGFTPLHEAAELGNLEIVNFLLQNGANVNAKTDRNYTPLHAAAFNGHLSIVNVLISKNADINATVIGGCTPLHYALEKGYEEIANVLLSHGAKVNVSDKAYNNTPLHYAAQDGLENSVKSLLKYGADAIARTIAGSTPLHFAAHNGYLEIVSVLVKHGVNIQIKDNKNATPLHYAIDNNQKDIVAFLIQNGAKVDAMDDEGFTPLYIAAQKGYKDIANLLLKNGACVDVRDVKGNTVLHAAAMKGSKEVIDILIEYKAEINPRNDDGMTPLYVAAINDCEDAIISLLDNGAEINTKDRVGLTPLHAAIAAGHKNIVELLIKNDALNSKSICDHMLIHLAIKTGRKEIVELLIANGVDVNGGSTDNYSTPLCTAIKYNHKEIVKILIENGATVNNEVFGPLSLAIFCGYRDIAEILIKKKAKIDAVDSEKATLLHIAAKKGERDIVKTLIKMGADVNAKTINNITPLFFAAQEGHEEVVELLIINGAILNVVSNEGLTPLHTAAVNGHSSVIKVLLQYGANMNIKDAKSRTSLELAVARGHLPIVKMLLQSKKIDLNAKRDDDWTVLHIAAQEGNLVVIKFLVNEGADVNCKNAAGSKPIHIAAREGFKDTVEYFLSIGCCINDLGAANQTLLHYAMMNNKLEIVKYLINQGANVNIKDGNGSSPLHIAAIFGSKNIIEVLFKNGAAYNAVDNFGRKALDVATKTNVTEYLMSTKTFFEAVKSNNVSEVKRCIQTGVVVDVKNTDGMTPLYFAAWKGHEEIVNILLQNNANPNTVGNKGVTPLHYAVKFSHYKIVKALLSHGAIFNAVSESGKTPADFGDNEHITKLFKIVADSFKFVKNGNAKVINNLNKIKDIDTIKAVMNTCNSDHETLIAVAVRCNFRKIEDLKNILQGDVSNMKNMALLLADKGDYQRAICIFNDLYEKRKSILGPNNPGTLDMERYIAIIMYKQGNYKDALCKLERIYLEQKKVLGLRNKDTLHTRSTIALVLHRQERNEEAFEIYQEVYHIQKEILGSNHPDTLDTEFHMALVLNGLGKYEEALNINKKIYKERGKKLGPNDPTTVRVQNNIAMVLASQGNYEQSLEIYKQVLEKKKLTLGLYHADTLRTLQSMASILAKQKKYLESLKAYQEVLDIQKTVLGPVNPETLKTQYNMATVFFTQGKFANALKIYTECFEPIKAVFGPNHEIVSSISQNLEIIKLRFKFEGSEASEILLHMQEDMKTAVENGNTTTILRLLKDGVDVNEKDDYGTTALHYAVSLGQIDVVNILLQNGADVFQVTNNYNTSLHLAVSKSNREIVEVLLQHVPHNKLSAFINAKTNSGNTTALHVAAKNNSLDIIKILLKYGAFYDVQNKEGKKPLNLATNQSVKNLLKLIEESFENTKNGKVTVIKRLESLKRSECRVVMNTRNQNGKTLVQVAIVNQHLEIARMLKRILELFND